VIGVFLYGIAAVHVFDDMCWPCKVQRHLDVITKLLVSWN